MLWVKTFHLLFVISWFAGLLYLPRIFVNLAQAQDAAVTQWLLGMARRLYRFTWPLAILSVVLGLWLWMGYGIGRGQGWVHAKLTIVVLLLGYQHACGRILRRFEQGENRRSHSFYRIFNEVPVVLLLLTLILVVLKPF